MNISSVIVHARPGTAAAVSARLAELGGVEVHGVSDEGRLVVTIETEDDRATTSIFQSIGSTDDVLSVSMVFHQTESDPDNEVSVDA